MSEVGARGGVRRLRLAGESEGGPEDLVGEYLATLGGRSASTVEVYGRILRSLAGWVAERPGGAGGFRPDLFTRTALETYLKELEARGYSVSHRSRVKSVASGFAGWLIEEKSLLRKNPTRGVEVPAQALLAPRWLSPDQRYVLKNLVERDGKGRSEAIFALGYWAACRVSDVSWLTTENCRVGPKVGRLRVGHKGGKARDIDLLNEVRRPLREYLLHGGRDTASPYVFTSQRSQRLTEAGVHHWLRTLKKKATKDEWELVSDVTFHDLRHDFAHRARAAGWSVEEVAYYLGHTTKKGTPAIQTTVRYTQVSREEVKEKLKGLGG
ncbi:MAG: tyrosine-type recombinase/integrase [Actinomycetota bacterium]|nr:tyrosine-type recombinase/integrase [Actinomycetota bacterium]MDP9485258.1 tyrosine-type recombinase/integrase [Actinomycetota bacterium]